MRKRGKRTGDVAQPVETTEDLRLWVERVLELKVPPRAVCPGHCTPMDYLRRAYFEPATDLVVWAPRGGGKTRLAAAATLLDLLHKPGCTVRILGGSLEQSLRMWEHLYPDIQKHADDLLAGRQRQGRLELTNGSSAAVLTQSQRAVRGLRVQKLRCDEVELFDPKVWEAAQLVTRSKQPIVGAIEAISTLHAPAGLMQRVVDTAHANGTPVIRWCLLDVLERCPAERSCAACPLAPECSGVAKTRCDGFFNIEDAIRMKRRVSIDTWESEMLCRRPVVRNCVFSTFDPAIHVREWTKAEGELWLAVDFGFANPFVCLWIWAGADGTSHVIDEYIQEQRTVAQHIAQIGQRKWGLAKLLACDPAGAGRNSQTAMSDVHLLRRAGYDVKHRSSTIVQGVDLIRTALHPAFGNTTLFIHPRCARLIKALRSYRYEGNGSEIPFKDGIHDHPIDALRYYFVNRRSGELSTRNY